MYDQVSTKIKSQDNVKQFDYTFFPPKFQNTAKCRIEMGGYANCLFTGNLVDSETAILRGQSTKR